MRLPRTLLTRFTLVIASVALFFQISAVVALILLVLIPQGKTASEQLARIIVYSAHAWAERPENQRAAYAEHVWQTHALRIRAGEASGEAVPKFLPFYHFLESAVRQRAASASPLYVDGSVSGQHWMWIDIQTAAGPVSIGLDRERYPKYPRLLGAVLLILGVGGVVALGVSAYLARILTRPLDRLSHAVKRLGAGEYPDPLPEDGPEELSHCARSFNRMTAQVQDLLAARTTLLAGISHDLRTPLARMRLALAMLADRHDPALATQLMRDVDDMNQLIERSLEMGRNVEEAPAMADIAALVQGVAREAGLEAGSVVRVGGPSLRLPVRGMALRRILYNLLDNAMKYAGRDGIALEIDGERQAIRVLDAGPGIPAGQLEAVFRPFYRLEPSRCAATGGTGLGLAIARQLADANGWQLTLENRAGGGLCATLFLRRAE